MKATELKIGDRVQINCGAMWPVMYGAVTKQEQTAYGPVTWVETDEHELTAIGHESTERGIGWRRLDPAECNGGEPSQRGSK